MLAQNIPILQEENKKNKKLLVILQKTNFFNKSGESITVDPGLYESELTENLLPNGKGCGPWITIKKEVTREEYFGVSEGWLQARSDIAQIKNI